MSPENKGGSDDTEDQDSANLSMLSPEKEIGEQTKPLNGLLSQFNQRSRQLTNEHNPLAKT